MAMMRRNEEKLIQSSSRSTVLSLPHISLLATYGFPLTDMSRILCDATNARDSVMEKPIAGVNRHVSSVDRLATTKHTASNASIASTAMAAILQLPRIVQNGS